jgi:Transmembrane domain of unknown function (DUF3566)
LSSREEKPSSWRSDPDATPASGGHIAPDITATGSPYDPLDAPLPSELERMERQRAERAERTEVIPHAQPVGAPPVAPVRRGRPVARRVKRTLRHVDPLSVLKISLFFYACALVVWMIFVAILFSIVNGMGLFDSIEEFGREMAIQGWKNLNIDLFYVEKWAFLVGFTFFVVGSILNTFLAFLYNVGADLIGGVDMTFVERDLSG